MTSCLTRFRIALQQSFRIIVNTEHHPGALRFLKDMWCSNQTLGGVFRCHPPWARRSVVSHPLSAVWAMCSCEFPGIGHLLHPHQHLVRLLLRLGQPRAVEQVHWHSRWMSQVLPSPPLPWPLPKTTVWFPDWDGLLLHALGSLLSAN